MKVNENSKAVEDILRRTWTLRQEIETRERELKNLHGELFRLTTFDEGCDTAHHRYGRLDVTVSVRRTMKWDQKRLNTTREYIGEKAFGSMFRTEWKADARKVRAFLDSAPENEAEAVRSAFTVTEAPSFSYRLDDAPEEA